MSLSSRALGTLVRYPSARGLRWAGAALASLAIVACGEKSPGGQSGAADASPAVAPPETPDVPPTRTVETPPPRRPRPTPPPVVLPDGWNRVARDAITVALSRDGAFLVGGDLGGYTAFWDTSNGRFKWADLAKAGRIRHVQCAETADLCVAGGFDGPEHTFRRYTTTPLENAGFIDLGDVAVKSLSLSADGALIGAFVMGEANQLIVHGPGDGDVRFQKAVLGTELKGGVVALSPDGTLLAWAPDTGGVEVHRVAAVAAEAAWTGAKDTVFTSVAWTSSADGASLLVAAETNNLVTFALPADSSTLTVAGRTSLRDDRYGIRALHRVADGKVLAGTRPSGGGLVFWDAATGSAHAEVATKCPCETHTLAFTGALAVCSCADQAEVRYGPLGATGSPKPSTPEDMP